jgi:hypothetical protein
MRFVALAALAACSFPAKHHGASDATSSDVHEIDDAPAADASPLGCAGRPFGTTAPPQIAISGEAADLGTGVVANGLTVEGSVEVTDAIVFTQNTDANGKFATSVVTNGSAIDAHVVTVAGTYAPSYYYPSHPFDADSDIPLPMLKPMELMQVGNPPNTALAELIIGDCLNVGLAGCTVSINPPPSLLEYSKNGIPTMSATSTEASGYAIAYGLLPGITTFNATCPDLAPLRTKQIQMVIDSTYFIRLQP